MGHWCKKTCIKYLLLTNCSFYLLLLYIYTVYTTLSGLIVLLDWWQKTAENHQHSKQSIYVWSVVWPPRVEKKANKETKPVELWWEDTDLFSRQEKKTTFCGVWLKARECFVVQASWNKLPTTTINSTNSLVEPQKHSEKTHGTIGKTKQYFLNK